MIDRLERLCGLVDRLARSTRALGAVEFAMAAPFMILLYVGSFQLMDAISAYRKVTVTARSLADLSTQNETATPDQIQQIMNGARQVMTPYSTAGASLVVAQIAIDGSGTPSITWVCVNGASPICSTSTPQLTIADVNVPANLKTAGNYLIYSQIVYHYTPSVAGSLIGPLTFGDHIFMNPRRSPSVCLANGTNPDGTTKCMGQEKS